MNCDDAMGGGEITDTMQYALELLRAENKRLRAFRDEVRAAKSRYDLYQSSGTGLASQIAAAIARLDIGKGE
jgi:K+-transporting ATPase c subunit